MNEYDVIKEIEKELRVNLEKHENDGVFFNRYVLNVNKNITTLNLQNCQIENLDRIIVNLRKLEQLTELTLNFNKLNDINPLKELKQLVKLDLNSNQLTNITPLKGLNELVKLDLSYNQLKDISPLKNLQNLKSLDLTANLIRDNVTIEKLIRNEELEYLGIALNSLEIMSKNLYLFLSNVRLSRDVIIQIKNHFVRKRDYEEAAVLRKIEKKLSINELMSTSESIDAKKLFFLYTFKTNPIKEPPIEVLSLDNEAILRYFEKIEEEGEDHIYEAKLTLVGEGSSGKTSLQRRLLNEKAALPRKDKRTRGIKIKNWQFKKQRGTKHIVHIWDFGGQDVYYPVHRFFITENSVFVLLASTRQSHHNFDYWIPTIYQFGGKSPIILGQTCHEGNKIRWNDLGVYISNTNFNIIKTQILPYYEINLPNKNEGLKKIKQTIINQITNLKHYGKGVPKSWIPVRNVLEEERKKTSCISFEKFKEICKNSNLERFTKLTDITDCCRFLHDIGVVLWYSTIDELKNWVILQPEWAMNAVYKIIDDEEIQKRRGNILNRDFSRLWQESSYEDKHPILKKMLEIFKIAFPKRHKQEDYIIPARLLSMPIEKRWRDNEPYLRLEYYYEFMPRGMVNQMSAELSRYIASDNEVWNNAVNFIYENKIAECQVEEDFYNRKINIRAKGKDARGLIILIMEALKNITDGYKGVKPEINVPCTCYKCKNSSRPTSFLYDDLLRWSEKEVNAIAFCNEGRIGLSIRELLHNLGLSNPLNEKDSSLPESLKLFVSYSKHDEDYLQDFQDHLVTLKEQGLVTFDCRDIEFGKEWDEEIKRKIDECNIIVCLISVKFLNTEYIKKIEVQKAIDQNKIIVPIIIKACDWESSSLGRYQAAQKGRIVSLDNNQLLIGKIKGNSEEEKAAFWTAIIKEFRKKLF